MDSGNLYRLDNINAEPHKKRRRVSNDNDISDFSLHTMLDMPCEISPGSKTKHADDESQRPVEGYKSYMYNDIPEGYNTLISTDSYNSNMNILKNGNISIMCQKNSDSSYPPEKCPNGNFSLKQGFLEEKTKERQNFEIDHLSKSSIYDNKQIKVDSEKNLKDHVDHEKQVLDNCIGSNTGSTTGQITNFYESNVTAVDMGITNNSELDNNKDGENQIIFSSQVSSNSKNENYFEFSNSQNLNFLSYGINQATKLPSTLSIWNPQQELKHNSSKINESIAKTDDNLVPKFYPMPFQNYYKELDVNSSENKNFSPNSEKTHRYLTELRQFYLQQNQVDIVNQSNQYNQENLHYGTMVTAPNQNINSANLNINVSSEDVHNRNIYNTIEGSYSTENYYKTEQSNGIRNINEPGINLKLYSDAEKYLKKNIENAFVPNYISSPGNVQESCTNSNYIANCIVEDMNSDNQSKLEILSPNAKQENQDDGYETSAGDVLTPNSYSSSNAATPHQQIISHISNSNKTEDLVNKSKNILNIEQNRILEEPSKTTNDAANHCCVDNIGKPANLEEIARTHDPCEAKIDEENKNYRDQNDALNRNFTQEVSQQKRRGRKKKIVIDSLEPRIHLNNGLVPNSTNISEKKDRKRHDRFNGTPEEEVVKRTVPDHLQENLDILIIGINPGLFAAYKGHHYAGPGNHFWKCLFLSGLIPEQMNAEEDSKLVNLGIGFTNLVSRPTKGSTDLSKREIKEGNEVLLGKLQKFKPKIAVFNGKFIFEIFSGKKDFNFGKQPDYIEGTTTYVWVMPSSSARCAQLPRATDKIPFYAALKKFRDFLNGTVSQIDDEECIFTDERIKSLCCLDSSKSHTSDAVIKNATSTDITIIKKKRGRPRKIKDENFSMSLTVDQGTLNRSVLNLSLAKQNQVIIKKKRGRPKKIRDASVTQVKESEAGLSNGVNNEKNSKDDRNESVSQFKTCSSNMQNQLFQTLSPINSPLMNCSYTAPTPPLYSDPSTPVYQQNHEILSGGPQKDFVEWGKEKNVPNFQNLVQLGETPPPSSPNICSDFDHLSSNMDHNQERRNNTILNQQNRFNTSKNIEISARRSSNDIRNWMTSQNNINNLSANYVTDTSIVNYPSNRNIAFGESDDWQRKSIYNDNLFRNESSSDNNKSVMHNQVPKQQISDVSRKSLSGLESLIDQIPTSANESILCPNATANTPIPSITSASNMFDKNINDKKSNELNQEVDRKSSLTSSRFSVSNIMDVNHSDNRHPYNHNDIMAAAALAAVAANQNHNAIHHVQHAPIYMDQHITHVPSGSMYGHQNNQHHPVTHHHASPYGQGHLDYSTHYAIPGQVNSIHMPNPNYPYSFNTSAQPSFSNYIHPHHTHSPSSNHLAMYGRLKSSNIGNFGGF